MTFQSSGKCGSFTLINETVTASIVNVNKMYIRVQLNIVAVKDERNNQRDKVSAEFEYLSKEI